MRQIFWMSALAAGCLSGKGTDTSTATDACETAAYHFEEGPDQLPEQLMGDLNAEVEDSLSDMLKGDDALAPQLAIASVGALNGQLAGYLADDLGSADQSDVYEASASLLISELQTSRRKGKKPLFVCGELDAWISKVSMSPAFSCEDASLPSAMTNILSGQFEAEISDGTLQGGVWLQLKVEGSGPAAHDLLWLPIFLAMQNGASPALLYYESPSSAGYVSILGLGIDVIGPQLAVDAFWAFARDGGFSADTYVPGELASVMSQLTLTAPTHVVWRDADGVERWSLGDVGTPPPFLEMDAGTAVIDPCEPLGVVNETTVIGGIDGVCVNTLELMYAVANEARGHVTNPTSVGSSICTAGPTYIADFAL